MTICMSNRSLYEIHMEFVERLKQRGEKVLQPMRGKPFGTILGYVKGMEHPVAGFISRDEDGTFGLHSEFFAHSYGNIKWKDLGICDSKCWYEWREEESLSSENKKGKKRYIEITFANKQEAVSAIKDIARRYFSQHEELELNLMLDRFSENL